MTSQGHFLRRCCYLTVNPETNTSLKGFGFYELSLHVKNNIILNMTKGIIFFNTFIFYHILAVKQNHYMTHLLRLVNTLLWCTRCKIHRYSSGKREKYSFLKRFLERLVICTPSFFKDVPRKLFEKFHSDWLKTLLLAKFQKLVMFWQSRHIL